MLPSCGCWERLKAGGEGDDRGWNGWMASPTQWTWVWVNSRSWWWAGRPGVLQSMGSQRVGLNWATQLNWTELSQASWILQQYDFLKKKKKSFFHEINTIQDMVLYFLCLFLLMFITFTYLFFAFSVRPPPSIPLFAAQTHTHTHSISLSV